MKSQASRRRLIMNYTPVWKIMPVSAGGGIGRRVEGRFRWEDTGRVRVCPIGTDQSSNSIVLETVSTILAGFNLPLEVDTAAPPTQQKVRDLLAKSSNAKLIDVYGFVKNLNECRERTHDLQAAMIVPFDGKQYDLEDGSHADEPAEWGWTEDEDGVILLRLVSGQPLANLVRHEMGHLLGIGRHHRGCAMDWASCEDRFCNECLKTIQQTCEVITLPD